MVTIYVVTGPPCSGKTTHVTDHAQPGDLVIDLDRIAHALGYPDTQIDWATQHPARTAAMVARASLIKRVMAGEFKGTTWIVDTAAVHRRGVQVIALDPGAAECHRRATEAGRPAATHEQIDRWYSVATVGTTSQSW